MAFFSLTDIKFKSEGPRFFNRATNFEFNNKRYPIDLGATDKAHYMMFKIFVQERTQFAKNYAEGEGRPTAQINQQSVAGTNATQALATGIDFAGDLINKAKTSIPSVPFFGELGKNAVKQFNDDQKYFVLSSKSKKYLVSKDFTQPIFKGYRELYLNTEPKFVIAEIKNEVGISYKGLIDLNEIQVVPFLYSGIKINPIDSLIVGCSAGLGNNGDDDIYDYTGKKLTSYKRHIDMATKNFVIHKIFEPMEYYILLNVKTKEETIFNADEILPNRKDVVMIRIKNDWFTFDLNSKQRKPFQK